MRHVLVCLGLLPLLACSGPPVEQNRDDLLAAPSVRRILPPRGLTTGGLRVTIDGENFAEGAKVYFGDNEGTEVTRVDEKQLTVLTPPSAAAQAVKLRVMNRDGQYATLDNAFFYDDQIPVIDVAELEGGRNEVVSSNEKVVTFAVKAEVEVKGVTDGVGKGPGIKAQVGWAPLSASAPLLEEFAWGEAHYLGDRGGRVGGSHERDLYQGTVTLPPAKGSDVRRYYFAARFSIDAGATWVVAGVRGSRAPPTADGFGIVKVQRAVVEWCKLGGPEVFPGQAPEPINWTKGPERLDIYAQAYHPDSTNREGPAQNLHIQLGYGPVGTHPDTEAWKWNDARFHSDVTGGIGDAPSNDQWVTTLPSDIQPGIYSLVYRMKVDNGPVRYCDADGSAENDFTLDQMPTLTVSPRQGGELVNWCKMNGEEPVAPPQLEIASGAESEMVYIQVYHPGITNGGDPADLVVHLGAGPENSPPSDPRWQWFSAPFNEHKNSNDEFAGSLPADLAPNRYSIAVRITLGPEGPPRYCDANGTGGEHDEPFETGAMGTAIKH